MGEHHVHGAAVDLPKIIGRRGQSLSAIARSSLRLNDELGLLRDEGSE